MSTNPYASQWRQFSKATTDHELQVLHDDDLYRHLRMSKPGTGIWRWDIITWPGSLAIRGDIGQELIFTRLQDMFDFFTPQRSRYGDGSLSINPEYWGEKTGQREVIEGYSESVFRTAVVEELKDFFENHQTYEPFEDLDLVCAVLAFYEELDDNWDVDPNCGPSAIDWAYSHSEILGQDFVTDTSFTGWNHHYILSLYAIVTTVQAYRSRNAGSPA